MQKFFKELLSYATVTTRLFYPQGDRRKFNKNYFEKEIKAAGFNGVLNVCQHLLNNHTDNPYENVDVLIGDIQLLLVDSYDYTKKTLKLNIKNFTLDDCLRDGAKVEVPKTKGLKLDTVKGLDPLDVIKCDGCGINLTEDDVYYYAAKGLKYCDIKCAPQGLA